MDKEYISQMIERLELAQRNEEFAKQRESLEEVVLRSRDVGLICQLGAVYRKRELWQDAENVLREARRLEPSQPEPYRSLGLVFFNRDDLPSEQSLRLAREAFSESIRLEALVNERLPATHSLLGSTYLSLGERQLAEREFQMALKLDPSYEEAYFNLALLKVEQDEGEAARLLEKAIEFDPKYTEAHQQLGILRQKVGNTLAAEYHFRRCLELDPQDYWSCLYLANALAVQGRASEAEQIYQAAIGLQPQNSAGLEFFANFLQSLSRTEEAEQFRAKARHFKTTTS
jgi:tetratricopeptide (TPR) repeat protein